MALLSFQILILSYRTLSLTSIDTWRHLYPKLSIAKDLFEKYFYIYFYFKSNLTKPHIFFSYVIVINIPGRLI